MKNLIWLLTVSMLLSGCAVKETFIPSRKPLETTAPAVVIPAQVRENTEPSTAPVTEPAGTESQAEENVVTLPILDEIAENVWVATAGASSRAIKAAENMLDWGCNTGLDPEEIREAATAWKESHDEAFLSQFQEQLRTVDDFYLLLVGQDGEIHEDTGAWAWGRERVEAIEIVMEVFGLR